MPEQRYRLDSPFLMTWRKVAGLAARILVIDGDKSMRRMLEVFLAKEGYLVDAAVRSP